MVNQMAAAILTLITFLFWSKNEQIFLQPRGHQNIRSHFNTSISSYNALNQTLMCSKTAGQ